MSAELAARRTAAAAVLGDFRRETDRYIDSNGTVPRPDMSTWAWRLYSELRSVLERLDAEDGQARSESADIAAAKRYHDPYRNWVNGEPPAGSQP